MRWQHDGTLWAGPTILVTPTWSCYACRGKSNRLCYTMVTVQASQCLWWSVKKTRSDLSILIFWGCPIENSPDQRKCDERPWKNWLSTTPIPQFPPSPTIPPPDLCSDVVWRHICLVPSLSSILRLYSTQYGLSILIFWDCPIEKSPDQRKCDERPWKS